MLNDRVEGDCGSFEVNLIQAYKKVWIIFNHNILSPTESYELCELKQVTELIPKLIFSLILNQNVQIRSIQKACISISMALLH